ncbi:hypothetical protein G6045_38700, partial [Streptomyces sp. YC504]|nr:hypothetical protein [Streptomyces mesophilus]
ASASAPVAVPARPAPSVPESLTELILRARELHEQGHPGDTACWARLRVLTAARDYRHPDDPAVGPLVQLRADLLTDEAYTARNKDEFDEAVALHEEAAGLYEDAGLAGHAAVAQACGLLAAAEAPTEGTPDGGPADDEAAATGAQIDALTAAHASIVRLHQETPGLTPHHEARLLRLRASALGIRLQTSHREEHIAPAHAELDLLQKCADRHRLAGQSSGAGLLRATLHALSGDLPGAVTRIDALLVRLRSEGPAWHLPRTLGLRGRLHLGLQDPQSAYTDLTEALRHAAEWPADSDDQGRYHQDLAEVCMHLGRPDEALRHLTRAAEQHLRHGSRVDGFCAYSNAAQLSVNLDRNEDAIALLDSVLTEPDIANGELDDRLTAQLRLTRARALHAGGDLKAATAEFAELAAESAGWDDDPGSHAMIAGETAVLLAETGEFGAARAALDQALAAHAKVPRYEQISNHLREAARLQAKQQGKEGLRDARALLADAERVAVAADRDGFKPMGRSLETALAYEHGRVNAYVGEYDSALAALDQAVALLGDLGPADERLGEWTECVRLAGAVEGLYMERTAPALARVDAAIARLTALGQAEEAAPLTELAAQIRDE